MLHLLSKSGTPWLVIAYSRPHSGQLFPGQCRDLAETPDYILKSSIGAQQMSEETHAKHDLAEPLGPLMRQVKVCLILLITCPNNSAHLTRRLYSRTRQNRCRSTAGACEKNQVLLVLGFLDYRRHGVVARLFSSLSFRRCGP